MVYLVKFRWLSGSKFSSFVRVFLAIHTNGGHLLGPHKIRLSAISLVVRENGQGPNYVGPLV